MGNLTRTFAREAKDMVNAWNQAANEIHNALQRYIFIGETLRRVKNGMAHGEFEPWIEANLPFGVRQAQRCMQFYDQTHTLKSPATDQLAGMWHELQHQTPKATSSSLLPPSEIEDLKHSEGGIEPEEESAQLKSPAAVKSLESAQPKATRASYLTKRSQVTEPSQSEEETEGDEGLVDADGVTIPAALASIFATTEQFDQLARELSIFKGRLEDAVEANPEAWSALDPQKRIAELLAIRHQFMEAKPYLICPTCGGEDPEKTCNLCHGRGWLSRFLARTVAIELRNPQRKAHGLALLTGTSQKAREETQ